VSEGAYYQKKGKGKTNIFRRGGGWFYVVELGRQPCRSCVECSKRHWIELEGDGPAKCQKCGGELAPVREQRRQKWSRQFKTEAEAKLERAKVVVDLAEGKDPFPKTITVREFVPRWLDYKETSGVRPRSLNRYRGLLASDVLPVIGSMRLDRVKVAHIRNVLDKAAARGLSIRSVQHVRGVVSALFTTAVEWELVPSNPVKAVKAVKAPRPELAVPTAAQAKALLEAAKGTQWPTAILLSVATGARRSEVLGLKWGEVDLDKRRVSIVRSLQRVPGKGLEFFGTKTERSRRLIILPPFAVAPLRAWKAEQAARQLAAGPAWHDSGLVCERGDGQPLDPDSFSHAVKRLMGKAGLDPATRLHDLRHGLATLLLEQGTDIVIVSAQLGHSSPGFTMSTYQHIRAGLAEQAADAIERAFGG
jgi:integrase